LGEAKFSSQRALAHIQKLAVEIGSRPAGSDTEKRAAEYIRGELAADGYATSLQEFPITSITDEGTNLQVLSPQERSVDAKALGGSVSDAAEGELIAAGIGRPEDFGSDARGKIALIQRGEITFGAKVANAQAAGTAGVLIYNNQAGNFTGNLTSASAIPAASISKEDGESLLSASGQPVRVRLEVKTQTETLTSRNVVARPPDGNCNIVAGGHYDSVPAGPGANDNGSGTAVVIEMARTRAAAGELANICYVLFGSEEIGLVGSAVYVASLADDDRAALKAMLNFDMLAVGDSWPFAGSPEVNAVADREATKLGLPHSVSAELPQNLGSDHASFIRAGIPSVIFNCFCDAHYHTAQDTIDYVQESRLGDAGNIGLAMIDDLLQPSPSGS